MQDGFHRDYLLRLPLPLAQLYSRAYNAKDARGRHDNCFYLLEALIKLAACPPTTVYLEEVARGEPRVPTLDSQLAQLALPSLGQWVAILRECSRHLGKRPDAASHPLGHLWDQLNTKHRDLRGVLALYQRIKNGPDGEPGGDKSCSLLQLIDALVQYRNGVFGHGAGRLATFFEDEMGPLLFPAVNDILAEGIFDFIGPRGSRLVYLTELRTIDEDHVELGLRELVGLQSERMSSLTLDAGRAAGLAPNRVGVLWKGRTVPLVMDPLLVFRENELADEVLFLNRDRNRQQVEYLSYTTGRTERDTAMAPAMRKLLSRITDADVDESALAELQKGSQILTEWDPSRVEEALARERTATSTTRRLGEFEILLELGRGGMGVVYLARQLSLGRLVALKMLPAELIGDDAALARFRREMRALGRCEHPNIVKVLSCGAMPDGQLYYAMEYVPGADLEQIWREVSGAAGQGDASGLGSTTWTRAVLSASRRIRRQTFEQTRVGSSDSTSADVGGTTLGESAGEADHEVLIAELGLPPLPELPSTDDDAGGYTRRVAMLMHDAALALDAVHDQDIVHRDIKPANLMLTPDAQRVVLMDFGLAKGAEMSLTASRSSGFLGTLRYSSPEQLAAAQLRVGPQADIRGLGITMWELLTRQRLFGEAADERQLTSWVLTRDVPLLRSVDSTLDADLEAIVARATERGTEDRIQTAGQFANYLDLYLQGKPLPIRTPSVAEMVRRWARENRGLVATILGAGIAVVLSVVVAFVLIARSRNEAVAAWKVAEVARKVAEDRKREMEEMVADTEVTRFHFDPDTIGRYAEFPGYWRIAELPPQSEDLRTLMLSTALGNDEHARRLANRAPYVAQALVGLDSTRRQKFLHDLIVPELMQPTSSRFVKLAAVRMGIALKFEDTQFAREAVLVLSDALVETSNAEQLKLKEQRQEALADDLKVAVRLLPAADSQRELSHIVALMQQTEDAHGLRMLCDAVFAAQGEVSQTQWEDIADRLVTVIGKDFRPEVLLELSDSFRSLPSVSKHLHVESGVKRLIEVINDSANPETHNRLVEFAEATVPFLSAPEYRQAADLYLQAMSEPQGSAVVQVFARCLTAMAIALAQADPEQGIEILLDAMRTTDRADALFVLSTGLGQLQQSGKLPESDGRKAVQRVVEAMDAAETSQSLRMLAESLARLLPATPSEDDLAAARERLLREMREDRPSDDLEEVSRGLAALPISLPPQNCLPTVRMLIGQLEKATTSQSIQSLGAALKLFAGKMTPAAAEDAAALIITEMKESPPEKIYALASGLSGLNSERTSLLSAETSKDACRVILDKLNDPQVSAPIDLGRLARSLAMLVGNAPDPGADEAIPRLMDALAVTADADAVQFLVDGLGALSGNLSVETGNTTVRQIVEKISNELETPQKQVLALGLAEVSIKLERADRFPNAVASNVVSNLAQAMDATTDGVEMQRLLEAMLMIVPKLPPRDNATRTVVARILASVQSTDDPIVIAVLARGWEVLARTERMTEAESRDAFPQLLAKLKEPANATARDELTKAAVAMVESSGSGQEVMHLNRALSTLHNDLDPDSLRVLLDCIQQLAGAIVDTDDVDEAKRQIIAITNDPFRLNDQVMNGLVQALDKLPGEIEVRELVEILKCPFCTSAAQESLLKMIGKQTNQDFMGDPWKLVAQAKEVGLDPEIFRQPPKRPPVLVPVDASADS